MTKTKLDSLRSILLHIVENLSGYKLILFSDTPVPPKRIFQLVLEKMEKEKARMNGILLSIIIPVYNVKQFLQECIDSLELTKIQDYQLILVDDGSTDGSGELCDLIASQYRATACVVIHKNNGGLSSARNCGLSKACGKYVAFIDSDDRIAQGAMEKVLAWAKASTSDICFMQALKFYPDGVTEDMNERISRAAVADKSKVEVIKHLVTRPKYPGSACTKLFRTEFMHENHLRFPDDRRHHEDLGFIRDCLLAASSYDVLDFPYYEYRQSRKGSITNSSSIKNYWDLGVFADESVDVLLNNANSGDNEINKLMMSFVAYEYSIMLWGYTKLDKANRGSAYKWLKRNQRVLNFGQSNILRAIRLISKCVGIRGTSVLLSIYKAKTRKR